MSSSTVLVLGGTGFVGGHLVAALCEQGHNVSILNRGKTEHSLPAGVERLVADRTDASQMRTALHGREWDAVYDVSGFVMAAGGSDLDDLLDLLDGRVGRYVYTSSIMAYDQNWGGVFPWSEDQPTNPDGPTSYGGFKAISEASLLRRHTETGFPATIARPAAIYGPDNNIFDMETPMFLRLLQSRPILVPHEGLVVGSYGHVDDLCRAMITMATHSDAPGQVFNVSGESVDARRYISVLADIVGVEPNIVDVPRSMLAELEDPEQTAVYGHLFKTRHHAMLNMNKIESLLGCSNEYTFESGHRQTFEWFHDQGWDQLHGALVDPLWKASWDFEREAVVAAELQKMGSSGA